MTMQGATITLARQIARRAIEEDLRNQGRKLSDFSLSDLVRAAESYLAAHPELLEQAAETIRQSPQLQRLIRKR